MLDKENDYILNAQPNKLPEESRRDGSFSSTSSSSKRKRGEGGYGNELSIALSESTKKMHKMMESIVGKIAETPKKDNQTDQILASRFEEVKRLQEMAELRMSLLDESGGEDNPRVKILKKLKDEGWEALHKKLLLSPTQSESD